MKLKKLTSVLLALMISVTSLNAFADTTYPSDISLKYQCGKLYYSKPKNLIIVSYEKYQDALSAINLMDNNSKIYLLKGNYDIENLKLIPEIQNSNIIIVGGVDSIPAYVETDLRMKINPKSIKRIAGQDRYETNKLTIKTKDVIVASGENYPDALSSANLVKKLKKSIKLVKTDQQSIEENGIYTIGGEKSIIHTFGKRIAGKDRYETNLETLKSVNAKAENVINVNGQDFRAPLFATNDIFGNNDRYIKLIDFKKYENKNDPELINLKNSIKSFLKGDFKKLIFKISPRNEIAFHKIIMPELNNYLQSWGITAESTKLENDKYAIYFKDRFTKSHIDSNRMMNYINALKNIIKKSNAENESSDLEKAKALAKYIIINSVYGKEQGRYPEFDNITKNHKGICNTFVTTNVAALNLMNIKSKMHYCLLRGGLHATLDVYSDGQWHNLEVTGFTTKPSKSYQVSSPKGENYRESDEITNKYVMDNF